MKQLYLIAFLLIGIVLVCLGQPSKSSETHHKINQYIRTGDANALSSHMKDMVELVVNNSAETYSKTQVIAILKDFFKDNQPIEFEVMQIWKEQHITHVLGNYTSPCGQYHFYYSLKPEQKNAFPVIFHINIEQTKKCKNKCNQNQNVSKP